VAQPFGIRCRLVLWVVVIVNSDEGFLVQLWNLQMQKRWRCEEACNRLLVAFVGGGQVAQTHQDVALSEYVYRATLLCNTE